MTPLVDNATQQQLEADAGEHWNETETDIWRYLMETV